MIIVSGASRGIGFYLFKEFINNDYDVIGLYNNTAIKGYNKNIYKLDITSIEHVKSFVDEIQTKSNNIVLVNCAGANYNAFAHKANPEKWKNLININLVGTFNLINLILPKMREDNYGRIINLSSIVAQKGVIGTSAYAASKSGLWGMTKAIALENASKGITINNLNLGYFDIGMISDVPTEMQDAIKKSIPLKKFGDPINILNAVEFLINSDYITGSSIDINGGLF